MDENDPEKRIAELERQLADLRATGDPGTNQGSPPGWTPSPPPFNDDSQQAPYPPPPPGGFPPPPVGWQSPAQQAPWQSTPSAGSRGGRRGVIFLVIGIAVVVLVIAGIGVAIALNSAKVFTSTSPTQGPSAGGVSTNKGSPTRASAAPGRSPSAAAGPSASAPAAPTQLLTADGMNGLLGTIRSKFGDTMGYELDVHPDNAVLTRDDPQNPRHKKEYLYMRGEWKEWGFESRASSFDFVTDLGKFDVAAVVGALNNAPQTLNITKVDSTYLIIRGADGGTLELNAYASSEIGDSGYIELNPDGSIKKTHPPS